MRIAILLTTYNRCAITEKCLYSITNAKIDGISLKIYIVDGGSDDNTVQMIRENFDSAVLVVKPNTYWNQGMATAWGHALAGDFDAYIWLNDDLDLISNWLQTLLMLHNEESHKSIIIGKVLDSETKEKIYGGLLRKKGISKINFALSTKDSDEIITFNGNCILVPRAVVNSIGIINSRFSHSFGDIDYGLRAYKANVGLVETPFAIGYSKKSINIYSNNFSVRPSFKSVFFSPKGLPLSEWLYFCRIHGGKIWLLNFLYRYYKIFLVIPKEKMEP